MNRLYLRFQQRHYASDAARNWMEKGCGDVPIHAIQFNDRLSRIMRQGHAAHVGAELVFKSQTEIKDVEKDCRERIQNAVNAHHVRFRPSILLPVYKLSSSLLGTVLPMLGENASQSVRDGLKFAISDFYNDQIREHLEHNPDDSRVKEVLKENRDQELAHLDAESIESEYKFDNSLGSVRSVKSCSKAAMNAIFTVTKFA